MALTLDVPRCAGMPRHWSGRRRGNRQRWPIHQDPCGSRLPLRLLHSTRSTCRNKVTLWALCFPLKKNLLTLSLLCHSSVYRLLLMEKYYERILVHPVTVWHDQQIRDGTGAPAHHDPCQPQGGSRVWVCVKRAQLPRKETDPVYCVNAHQRDVFFPLTWPLLRWKSTQEVCVIIWGTYGFILMCHAGCSFTYCKVVFRGFQSLWHTAHLLNWTTLIFLLPSAENWPDQKFFWY